MESCHVFGIRIEESETEGQRNRDQTSVLCPYRSLQACPPLALCPFAPRLLESELRVCSEITCAFWRARRAGRCKAPRRRRCRCASSRSGNAAAARPPPRPFGLRSAGTLAALLAPYIPQRVCSSLAPCQRAWGPAAKCACYSRTDPKALVWFRLVRVGVGRSPTAAALIRIIAGEAVSSIGK